MIDFSKVTTPKKWEPSRYQEAIFNKVEADRESISCVGVPGCGKTTTGVEVTKRIRSGMALSFNKAIQKELETKLTGGWSAYTFHKLGLEACRKFRAEISGRGWQSKDYRYAKQRIPSNYEASYYPVAKALGHAKNLGFGVLLDNTEENWRALLDGYNVDIPWTEVDHVLPLLPGIYDTVVADTSVITFDEMILWPLLYNIRCRTFSDVLVDETQDLSLLQHRFLYERLLSPNGRVIAFGDPLQSIYAFRGADHLAMDHFRDTFECVEMPLSISYRLPQCGVELAKRVCQEIEARAAAPEGSIEMWTHYHPNVDVFEERAMILCRANAPLIRLGLQFLREGRQCRLRSDLSDTLLAFIKKCDTDDMKVFRKKLDDWYTTEKRKAQEKKAYRAVGAIEDRYQTFEVLITECDSVTAMVQKIKYIFSVTRGPLLSTVHRAKGLEAGSVYLLRPDLFFPTTENMREWERQQEINVWYVAITRFMEKLVFMPGEIFPYHSELHP